jgi:hypothetical protein
MEDKQGHRFFLVSDPSNADAMQSAISKILADGNRACVVWQPPLPFLADYFPYPQNNGGLALNDWK